METRHIIDEKAMFQEAMRFAATLAPRADRATIVALSGELGGGKTTFVQGVAAFYGVSETVTSPTFVIEKRYQLKETVFGFERLIHIDAYRIEDPKEMEKLDFSATLADPKNLVFVEWPEKLGSLIPEDARRLAFALGDGPERFMSYADEA